MYWQVYLHKTGVAADVMLRNIINRAKSLSHQEDIAGSTGVFTKFLHNDYKIEDFNDTNLMEDFIQLDDFDIWSSVKIWVHHSDPILSYLSRSLLHRNLYKIQLTNQPLTTEYKAFKQEFEKNYQIEHKDIEYFLTTGSISNAAYMASNQKIRILKKDRTVMDIEQTADLPNIKAISKIVTKHYLCWAKNVSL